MGSAALRDAIQGIIDWGETVGGVNGGLPKATEAFGSLTFNDEAQKARLPKTAYAALRQTIVQGQPLDADVADLVAGALKEWALEHGATHYTRSSRSPASPRRSTTASSRRTAMARRWPSSAARS